MSRNKDIAKIENNTSSIIEKTIASIGEGISGIAETGKEGLLTKFGEILQKSRGHNIMGEILKEWKHLRELGKIDDEYQKCEQHISCLHELLDFIENDIPDRDRVTILKQIFFVAATEEHSERKSIIPQQFMQICKSLSSGEAYLLSVIYKISEMSEWKNVKHHSGASWCDEIKKNSDFEFKELIETHEDGLIRKRLLIDRVYGDRSGVLMNEHFRLTELGYALCNYIAYYENIYA